MKLIAIDDRKMYHAVLPRQPPPAFFSKVRPYLCIN